MIKNKSKFAKEIGISRRRLYTYIGEGMPLDSEESACEWIELHYGSGGGKHLKVGNHGNGGSFDPARPPGIQVGSADIDRVDVTGVLARQVENEFVAWTLLQDARKAAGNMVVPSSVLSDLGNALQSGDSGLVLKAAKSVVDSARREVSLAKVSAATRHYNLCSAARLKTEEALVRLQGEELSVEGLAVQMAKKALVKVLRPLRQALRTMPSRLAPRCNPAATEVARGILEEEVARIFRSIQEEKLGGEPG